MSASGIQGHLLEATVVGCSKLKDTEWFSRQDPYVCLEYGSNRVRTRTCTDGGKTPTFQEKFTFSLIEGLRDLNVVVWNSNTISMDDFIGSGKIQLHKVLSQGYDDSSWTIQTKTGRYAGEVRLILHYANSHKPGTGYGPSVPQYSAPPMAQPSMYSAPPPAPAVPYQYPSAYPGQNPSPSPSPYPSYPPNGGGYPQASYPPAAYPPAPYPPTSTYPPSSTYPPATYPPSTYPQSAPSYYPPGPFPGLYPPRPY